MAAYPDPAENGDTVGQNLLTLPKFPGGSSVDISEHWTTSAGTSVSEGKSGAGLDGGWGQRVNLSDSATEGTFKTALPAASFEPGDAVQVFLRLYKYYTGPTGVFLAPIGKNAIVLTVPEAQLEMSVDEPGDGTFFDTELTGMLPDWDSLTTYSGMGNTDHTLADIQGWQFRLEFDDGTSIALSYARVDLASVIPGYIDGDTEDEDQQTYEWEGTTGESASVAKARNRVPVEPDPDPDPDPTPEVGPLAKKTAAFLGRPDDAALLAQAQVHVEVVTAYVEGYTRGRGFNEDGEPNRQMSLVIVSATARLANNPEQVTYYTTGDYSERPALLAGWTLPELAILNNYRRRYA